MRASTGTIVFRTLFISALVAVASASATIYFGIFNVAASEIDNPVVAYVLHLASDRSVAVRLNDVEIPADLGNPQSIKAGAKLFGTNCIVCHGGPGLMPTSIARGLNPSPPDLFRAGRYAEPDETFWFIKNGVRMTGMPSFGKTHSDDEVWSIAAFLKLAPGMSAQDFISQTGIDPAAQGMKRAGG